jgi:hypothetical protein
MRLAGLVVAVVATSLLAGCRLSVSDVNQRPGKYYQDSVTLRGQVMRMQNLTGETLLEIADARGARILVQVKGSFEHATGDWIKVRGILVPEARVGDQVLYDVVVAEDIGGAGRPWFTNLF